MNFYFIQINEMMELIFSCFNVLFNLFEIDQINHSINQLLSFYLRWMSHWFTKWGENASKMKIHEDKTQLIFFCQIFSRAQKKVHLQGVGPLDGNLTFLWITQKLKTKEKVLFIIHVKNNTVALYKVKSVHRKRKIPM